MPATTCCSPASNLVASGVGVAPCAEEALVDEAGSDGVVVEVTAVPPVEATGPNAVFEWSYDDVFVGQTPGRRMCVPVRTVSDFARFRCDYVTDSGATP